MSTSEIRRSIGLKFAVGLGPISVLGADKDLVDHGYRTVAPGLEQD